MPPHIASHSWVELLAEVMGLGNVTDVIAVKANAITFPTKRPLPND
ncbi:MAG: hypothetical protein AAFP03_17530 [Cyanobacteria bacterium J06598_3]